MKNPVTKEFKDALQDYLFLRNRKYPEKQSIKLVGDRYGLSGLQRTILYRGIDSGINAENRKKRLTNDIKGKSLFLDGHNVCFTLMNYLSGKFIFIANDGLVRDTGNGYGKVVDERAFSGAVELLATFTASVPAGSVTIYLDAPVSGSRSHARLLKEAIIHPVIPVDIECVPSADEAIGLIDNRDGVIGTSDSRVIDAAECSTCDIAGNILKNKPGVKIIALETFTQL